MKISTQLYSIRDALAADFQSAITRLVDLGFDTAEPFNLVKYRQDLISAREHNNITFPSAHQGFLGDVNFDEVLDAAQAVGVTYLIQPSSPATDWGNPEKLRQLAEQLNTQAERAATVGIQVGYHNHEFEVTTSHRGRTALETFAEYLDPRVVLEIDTYWAVAGGANITSLLANLGERVRLVHLKDGDLRNDPDHQLPVGTGDMPVVETLDAARGTEYGVIEFDDYAGDIYNGLSESLQYLRSKI